MNEPPNPEVVVFAAALELPVDQRGAYLDQACAGTPALRQQVEALLRVYDDAGNFFDRLRPAARPTSAEGAVSSSGTIQLPGTPAEKTGDRIGRYKLLQQIGEGGCGVVYMAEQEEPVRRRVALKVVKLGMDTKNVIARFEAERQALALMDHPNIAKVLDAGATDTGRPYFVMELVRGIKITDYCDGNNLSTVARLELFVLVCQAIQHAHQKGIIHRDIKPSNILVADHDGVPVPKIIDFGIAKATTDQRLTDKTLFTAFEQFIGTPAYMSPEQARLSGLDIDTRSDIYSLGVLLYELLTAKTPFEAKRLHEMGLDEIRRIIREEEPLRPSTRLQTLDAAEQTTVARHRQSDPPKLEHLIRGDLDWIVMKALEKDRTRRYDTANGLAMDIQRHLNCEPVVARPPSRLYKFQKTVRRHKVAFAAAVAIAAALAIGTTLSTWQAVRATREQRIASQQRDRAVRAEAEAQKQKLTAQAETRSAAEQLADSLISQGDALTTAAQFPAAYARYAEAEDKLQQLGSPLARLDLSLVRFYRSSPPPLWTRNLSNYINSLVLLPSRKEVIADCADGKFYALDPISGRVVRSFGNCFGVQHIAMATSAGEPVLVAAGAGFVKLINVNGTVLGQVDDDRAARFCVASRDGSVVASGNDSGIVTIWETATFKKLGGRQEGKPVEYAAFSHDGASIAMVGENITLWDAKTGQQLRRIPAPASTRVEFSADDRTLFCAEIGGFITAMSLDGKRLARWMASRSNGGIYSLVASPEGSRLITASEDGELRIFDDSFGGAWISTLTMATARGRLSQALYIPDPGPKTCPATSGLLAADQGVVIACTMQGQIFAWPLVAPDRLNGRIFDAISVSLDGLLYAGQVSGRVEVRDMATGRTLRLLPQTVNCRATAFSRDSSHLYIGGDDGVLRAFNVLHGEYVWSIQAHDRPVCSIDISSDGSLIVSAGEDGTTRVWDIRTGSLLRSLHPQGGYGTAAIFVPSKEASGPAMGVGGYFPSRQRVIVGAGDSTSLYDWDVFSEAEPRRLYMPGFIRGLSLSPDQKLVAVAMVNHGASLLKTATLEEVGFLGPVPSAMYKVCFIDTGAGPGSWAFSCGGRELRAFEMSTDRERLVFDSTLDAQATATTDTGTYSPNTLASSGDGTKVVARWTDRINLLLARHYRDLLRDASPVAQAQWYGEWGAWAWVRELLERERVAGREYPPLLLARANWMCGEYDSARHDFDLAVGRNELPAWYGTLCASLEDTPPTIALLAAAPRAKDSLEQSPAAEPLPDGVLAAGEIPTLNSLIGKDVIVEGVVTDSAWSRSGKIMNMAFASVDGDKRGLLSCIFLKDRTAFDAAFGGDAAKAFSGARLRLSGKLEHYGGFDQTLKGFPQLVLTNPIQVKIVEPPPAHGRLPVPVSVSGRRPHDAEIAFKQAVMLVEQGKFAEAETPCRKALALYQQLALDDSNHSDYFIQAGHTQWRLAELLEKTGRSDQAQQVQREALQLFGQAAHDFPGEFFLRQEEAFTSWVLAEMLQRANLLDKAEAEFRQAIALHEKASADFPNETVFTERLGTLKLRLAEMLIQLGRLPEAKPMYQDVAERGNASDQNELAWFLATSADSNLRDGTNAVAFGEKAVAATQRKNIGYLDTLAAAYAETGQFAKAIGAAQEAITLSQSEEEKKGLASRLKLYESNSPYRDDGALAMLAMARLREGKFAEAEGLARECLTLREIQIPDDWRTFNARSMLGGALLGLKKYVEAEPLLLSGYEGLKQREDKIPPAGMIRPQEALQRLVQLHENTERSDQAARWKNELGGWTNKTNLPR